MTDDSAPPPAAPAAASTTPAPPGDDEDPYPFTPVPLRSRRDGWTAARQRGFVAALARIGSVSAACRSVGMSRKSLYALRDRPEAESFCVAWDQAHEAGRDALRDAVIDRCLHGGFVPTYREGRLTGMRFQHFDRLAIAVLSGRGRDIDQELEDKARRRACRQGLRLAEQERAEREAAEADYRRRYQEELDEILERSRRIAARARPRVVML